MTPPDRDLPGEIGAALTDPSIQHAVGAATRLVAARRREVVSDFAGYEAARDRARAIKEAAIERLPELVETVTAAVESGGGRVHWAEDAAAVGRIFAEIAAREDCRTAVKSKSMTSEEVHLNDALEAAGMTVRETDLGEYIVQLDDDRPSHIIAPILHKSVEDVRQAFRRGLGIDDVPETPEELTQLARERLREEFLEADMGITGANFVVAESGTVIVVENEGNARMCTQVPRVHVALAGVEKLIPTFADLHPFMELLPRSATGQLLSVYLSVITGPGWNGSPFVQGDRTFDLVLLDNGRMAMRDDPVLREALYCVRCGACLNVCAPYQAVGGHVFGGDTYQSGIGAAWEAGVSGLDDASQFAHLCSTCSRCEEVCPVRIDIPWMNSTLRGRIAESAEVPPGRFDELLREPRRLYEKIRRTPASDWLGSVPPVRWFLESAAGIDRRRPLPELAAETLTDWHSARGGAVVRAGAAADHIDPGPKTLVFWADCHTEHIEASSGSAAVQVLERLGYDVVVATGSCCGRAALSQGDLAAAREQSSSLRGLLEPFVNAGAPIVGLEPSCLACVVIEHEHLAPDDDAALALAARTRDLFEFLAEHRSQLVELVGEVDASDRVATVHGHCQQRTSGWFPAVTEVLGTLPGLRVQTTSAECCGMAGSYGYKTSTYAISEELGRRLVGEIDQLAQNAADEHEVLACGTSCRAQIRDLGDTDVRHPIEILEEATR